MNEIKIYTDDEININKILNKKIAINLKQLQLLVLAHKVTDKV